MEISIFGLTVGSSRGNTPIKMVDDRTGNGWAMDEWYQVTSHMKTPNIIVSDRIWNLTLLRQDVGLFWTQSIRIFDVFVCKRGLTLLPVLNKQLY